MFIFGVLNFLLCFLNGGIIGSPNPLSVLIHTDIAVHQCILKLGLRLRKFKFLLRDIVFKFLVFVLAFEFAGDVVRLIDFVFCQHFELIQIVVKKAFTIRRNFFQLGRHLVVVIFVEHCVAKRFVKIVGRRKRRFKFLVNFVKPIGNFVQNTKERFVKRLDCFILLDAVFQFIKLIIQLVFGFVKQVINRRLDIPKRRISSFLFPISKTSFKVATRVIVSPPRLL